MYSLMWGTRTRILGQLDQNLPIPSNCGGRALCLIFSVDYLSIDRPPTGTLYSKGRVRKVTGCVLFAQRKQQMSHIILYIKFPFFPHCNHGNDCIMKYDIINVGSVCVIKHYNCMPRKCQIKNLHKLLRTLLSIS